MDIRDNFPTTREYRPDAGRPVRYGVSSDVGRVRHSNEDAYVLLPEHGLFAVADGLGGYAGGDVASRTAMHAMGEFFRATAESDASAMDGGRGEDGDARGRLESAVKFANTIVWNMALKDDDLVGMGTTVAAIAIDALGRRVVWAHVGDSRVYRLRGGELTSLTRDHSVARLMWMAGREQVVDVPQSLWNATLFRALGMSPTVEVDLGEEAIQLGDRYLLVSDGLTLELSDEEISERLAVGGGPAATSRNLVGSALAKGGRDNVTVVVADV